MKILLCGSRGFIGRHIRAALEQAGHQVVAGVSPSAANSTAPAQPNSESTVTIDFSHDTDVATWLPRLTGIDAVINAIGVLRDSRARPMDAIHTATPMALFDACVQSGIRRVVHVSALGIDNNPTHYAQSKLAAETHLLALNTQGKLNAVALRPSIVFGRGGASSQLFMGLARLPLLWLPEPVLRAKVQPIQVQQLAYVVSTLMDNASTTSGMLECCGPEAVTLADFIASLRAQQGSRPAKVFRLPNVLSQLSARAGDLVPAVPWCSETLAMLGTDNVANPAAFAALLGHSATPYHALVQAAW